MKMKKVLFIAMLIASINAFAQNKADIKFEEITYDFGTFPEESPIVTGTFVFTNVGDAPLVIHQATASCGCAVPEYTKEPIMPGKKGEVKVTYNGKGKLPGAFKKSITLRTNAKTEMIRLYVTGNMTAKK